MRSRSRSPRRPVLGVVAALAVAVMATTAAVLVARYTTLSGVEVIPRRQWDTSPPLPPPERPQTVRRIIIHHDAVTYRPEQTGEDKARALVRAAHRDHGWIDVPYHYLIDRDGRVFAGRAEDTGGDTSTPYDPSDALHIALLGNYDVLEPTSAQLAALVALVRMKAEQYGLGSDAIKLHGELVVTDCPGANVRSRLAALSWR